MASKVGGVGATGGADAAGGAGGGGNAQYAAAQEKALKQAQELQLLEAKFKPLFAAAQKQIG